MILQSRIIHVMQMVRYFSNSRMIELFEELGVELTKENKKEINMILHEMLSVDYKNDPATWKMIRQKLKYDSDGFKKRLKVALSKYIVS